MRNRTRSYLTGRLLVAVVVGCVSLTCAAETQTWQIDPNHTAAQFSVRHLGISTVRGVFEKTTGIVNFDPADPSKTSIEATIDANSVNRRVQMRDNDLRSPHFLEVEKYPTITFKSTRAEAAGAGKLKIIGDLTIHGVTKQVVLDVDTSSQAIKDPMGKGMRMGANATTKVNRNDFGVTTMPGVVGDEIQIVLDIKDATRKMNMAKKRICFILQVKPERLEEYKRRHCSVWPEMLQALRETGWNNYSLFLREDGVLVGYLETEDFENARAGMAGREVNERWQCEMKDYFVQPAGLLPDRAMQPLEEVFHLD